MEEQNRNSTRWISVVAVVVVLAIIIGILLPAVSQIRNAAHRTHSMNNLRQMALCASNYESARMVLPTASLKLKGGQFEHGWATALAPFMESSNLYSRIDGDQPWDSAHNSLLFSQSLPWYLNPIGDGAFDKDGYGLNHYTANSAVFVETGDPVTLDSVDGKEIVFAEICDGYLPWGQPGNVRPPANGINFDATSYGNPYLDGAGVALADLSTHWRESTSERPRKRTTATYTRRPFELGGTSTIARFSYCSEYSPVYAGSIVFFGVHAGDWKTMGCYFREGDSITDADLYRLKRLTNFKGLELGTGSRVTEDGIETICELTELVHLSLGDVVVSDGTLQKLQQLKNLKSLELVGTKLSEEGIDAFRQALANCEVRVLPTDEGDYRPTGSTP